MVIKYYVTSREFVQKLRQVSKLKERLRDIDDDVEKIGVDIILFVDYYKNKGVISYNIAAHAFYI
jgi:hypothetical protein